MSMGVFEMSSTRLWRGYSPKGKSRPSDWSAHLILDNVHLVENPRNPAMILLKVFRYKGKNLR